MSDIVERLNAVASDWPTDAAEYGIIEAAAVIKRLRAELAKAVPADYVVVPREPTEAMMEAGRGVRLSANADANSLFTWHAMIAAGEKP